MRRTYSVKTECGCQRVMDHPHHGYAFCRTRNDAGELHGLQRVIHVEKAGWKVAP